MRVYWNFLGKKGHWTVNYTNTQSVKDVDLPIALIYRSGYFVNHHWGCKSIGHPLSYPLRYLAMSLTLFDSFISIWSLLRLIFLFRTELETYLQSTFHFLEKNLPPVLAEFLHFDKVGNVHCIIDSFPRIVKW